VGVKVEKIKWSQIVEGCFECCAQRLAWKTPELHSEVMRVF
jgi:hypothetical protein